jgi:D-sedoheptulose 7-phosphate isomerase
MTKPMAAKVAEEHVLRRQISDSAEAVASLLTQTDAIERACRALVRALRSGAKALAAGNGGSAAEAMHCAEELVGRFRSDRVALPAISLAADPTVLTCIANDFGFENIFSRQVEALGKPGDILLLFSSSGNSANLLQARKTARARQLTTIALLGGDGGKMAGQSDIDIIVPCTKTERIQEAHQVVVHLLLDAVERAFACQADGGQP